MRWLSIPFSIKSSIGRGDFAIALVAACALFWLGIQVSTAALSWMAEVLAPRGVNAGFALNLIWLALGVVLVWCLMALTAKRLRDIGRSPWWAVAGVVPLGVLALLNDAIFLVSRSFVLPAVLNWALLIGAGGIALWVLSESLLRPSRHQSP
jgi:uncharacterized membrane protein YhaH (DUF805 family)